MKKFILAFISIALLFLVWYFFLKAYDYQVNFTAPTTVGTVNQSIKSWNSSLPNPQPIIQKSPNELIQTVQFGDSTHTYQWNIVQANDSIVKVTLGAKDEIHSFKNRLAVPFSDEGFEGLTKKKAKEFHTLLHNHLKEIRITIVGESEIPASFCAYVPLKGIQLKKARRMMQNYSLLTSFMIKGNLEPKGSPFIEVTNWEKATDSITYNFCFPIVRPDSLPKHKEIRFKEIVAKKALKALYNGNYITSDRAWYALEEYAKSNSLTVEATPFEIFYNNPNMGGDELNWEAQIFLPLKD